MHVNGVFGTPLRDLSRTLGYAALSAGPYDTRRREFLQRVSLLATLATTYPVAVLAQRRLARATAEVPPWRAEQPWQTLAEVFEHLLPAGDGIPGASDIAAIAYLRNAIDDPAADGRDKPFIGDGVGWLNDLTIERHQQPFTELDETRREQTLREIEQSRAGRDWLSMLVTYLLEALLADPVYGGNVDGRGWAWLQHQSGYPTPPPDRRWPAIARQVQGRRKA